jgi:hypothetical protein
MRVIPTNIAVSFKQSAKLCVLNLLGHVSFHCRVRGRFCVSSPTNDSTLWMQNIFRLVAYGMNARLSSILMTLVSNKQSV